MEEINKETQAMLKQSPFEWEVAEEDEYFSVDDYSPEDGVKLRFYIDEEEDL